MGFAVFALTFLIEFAVINHLIFVGLAPTPAARAVAICDMEKLPSRHPVPRAVHLRSSVLIGTTQHDLSCLVQGPLSTLP